MAAVGAREKAYCCGGRATRCNLQWSERQSSFPSLGLDFETRAVKQAATVPDCGISAVSMAATTGCIKQCYSGASVERKTAGKRIDSRRKEAAC